MLGQTQAQEQSQKPENDRIRIETSTGRPNRQINFTSYNEGTSKAKAKNIVHFLRPHPLSLSLHADHAWRWVM